MYFVKEFLVNVKDIFIFEKCVMKRKIFSGSLLLLFFPHFFPGNDDMSVLLGKVVG
jgi:hypothetical protein